ncbi:hypothetical protein [Catenuloplanes atrovinosus]|uniref:Uncharacterized protein n=1 Tax=Catenuloplanes atrovinosus TaxID=137266 RepID=A0AAE4C9S5_9ACTN|nr:hypothetical protein [Catenuloplanes atrovinosus]MDR7273885.1 hypothetical protein [Catenuloplanes atrovinosus]
MDTSFFGDRPLETPAMPGAFTRLAELVAGRFQGRVHLISKAGPEVERNTRDRLHHHDFFTRTGVPAENVHVVRERRDKAAVCTRLGITHSIDDRPDVLAHLTTVPHRYLMGSPHVPDWGTLAMLCQQQDPKP